jgi:outer membrane protein assembly factor BamE (lipoprotein component of BamABCDE complex)
MKRFQPITLLLLAALAACSPKVDNHGYMQQGDIKDKIIVGQTTKDEVMAALGSPSARSTFGEESWYYISSSQETVAFFKPQIADQTVMRVEFDAAGVVSKLDSYTKDSGKDFDIAKGETPTEGHSMNIMEQFLGNIGRFNKPLGGTSLPGQHNIPGGY